MLVFSPKKVRTSTCPVFLVEPLFLPENVELSCMNSGPDRFRSELRRTFRAGLCQEF